MGIWNTITQAIETMEKEYDEWWNDLSAEEKANYYVYNNSQDFAGRGL